MSSAANGGRRERLAATLRRHPATVIATVALFSSLLGTATATQVLVVESSQTARDASARTTSKQIAQLEQRLSAVTAKKKKARRGPRGPAGPAGSNASLTGAAAGGDLAGSTFPNLILAPGTVTPGKIGTIPAVSATQTAAVNIPSGTPTSAGLNSESFDTANMHGTGATSSRLTAPITGIYQISGHVNWAANNAGERIIDLYEGGSQVFSMAGERNNDTDVMVQPFAALIRLTAGEYVQLFLYHDAGGNLMARADQFAMHWVGP